MKIVYLLLVLSILVGCGSQGITITGTLQSAESINSAGRLSELLAPYSAQAALIIAKDGAAVYLPKSSFALVDIIPYGRKGWQSKGDKLPNFSNIKDIAEISLYSGNNDYGLVIYDGAEEIDYFTPFRAKLEQYDQYGRGNKNEYDAIKYNFRESFKLDFAVDSVMVLTSLGSYKKMSSNDFSSNLKVNQFYFSVAADTILAVWENEVEKDIFDLHRFMYFNENPLLTIFVDSYGYHFHKHLQASGEENFLHALDIQPLRVAYPPKTKYNYWAIGMGVSRQDTKDILNCPSQCPLLKECLESGKIFPNLPYQNPAIIGGPLQLYQSEIEYIAVIDTLEYHDHAIYRKAKEHLNEKDFLFVHFDAIDNAGHTYGAYSKERLQQVSIVAEYIESLIAEWQDDILIFSDHGMHNRYQKGTHYTAREYDLIGVYSIIRRN